MAQKFPLVPELQISMTPVELGAASDIIRAIYSGSTNKREYNRLLRSLTSVLVSLLAVRGRKLAKGVILSHIDHKIDLATQEVRYIFFFSADPEVLKEAFGN